MSSPTVLRPAALRPLVVAVALLAVLASGLAAAVVAPGSRTAGTVVGMSEPEPVLAGTATSSTRQLYKFSSVLAGKPVRWNPCAPIHWRFRAANAPRGGFYVVKAAIARVQRATGIRFVYDGLSASVPSTRWLPTTTAKVPPVLIGWTDGSHSDLLRGVPSGVLGVTRTAYFGTTVNGVQVAATKAAVIALDRTDRLPLTGSVSWSAVLQHEMGHVMGLDHVGNARQLMYPMLQRSLLNLQAGDLLGLARLGRAAGCINLPF
jgi:hypothetical protein